MNDKIQWGIIGLGNIATKFAEDLQHSKNSVLKGVASRDLSKAEEFGKKFKAVSSYGSYEELAADNEIDVVYIATPHVFHFENTMMCLKEGKAVLCEKPMGINVEQVQTMVQEARSRNLFLMEGMWTRFIPATEKLLELLEKKSIGDIQHITADFGFKAPFELNGRLFNKKLGGGSLLDVGIYPIYFSLLTLGMPQLIKATARITVSGVDSYCAMLFDYPNGERANLESAIESNTPIEARIFGTDGTITLHKSFHHTERITLSQNETEEVFQINYVGNGYFHEIEEVNKCIVEGKVESEKYSLETSLNLMKIIDSVKKEIGLVYNT